jgi:hypothetical protein
MTIVLAGFDNVDPANTLCMAASSRTCVDPPAHVDQANLPPHQETPARQPENKGVSVIQENVLRPRTGVVRKLRVLKS